MCNLDLNIFAIIILIALLVVIYLTKDTINVKSRLFRMMILTTILMNVLEIFSWIFDGLSGNLNYFLNFSFNFLFTALNTVVVGLWACYIDYLVHKDYALLRKKWYYFLPSIIMVVLSIINIFYPILFEISQTNIYNRLPLIWISLPLTLFLYIYILRMVVKEDRDDNRRIVIGVLIFLTFPIIAAILQLLFYGYQLIWPSTAVAILISYLIFETTSNSRDYLTGLFNRERAEDLIDRNLLKKKNFSVIMLDINDFKELNDTLGHHYGDKVLIAMAQVLKSVFKETSLISRYGGDEFLVVSDIYDIEEINIKRLMIYSKLRTLQDKNIQNVKFSLGISICTCENDNTIDQIIIEADNKMYEDKEMMKKNKENK